MTETCGFDTLGCLVNQNEISERLFSRPTVEVARLLLGVEITYRDCSGIIVETEAYTDDPASHWVTRPNKGRLLGETFGRIYIYTIYGIHRCLNFTTDAHAPGAVLIRALEPTAGISEMRIRRGKEDLRALSSGPAKLYDALGIDASIHGGNVLTHLGLSHAKHFRESNIGTSARIGISKGKDLDWRFFVKGNRFVSR